MMIFTLGDGDDFADVIHVREKGRTKINDSCEGTYSSRSDRLGGQAGSNQVVDNLLERTLILRSKLLDLGGDVGIEGDGSAHAS